MAKSTKNKLDFTPEQLAILQNLAGFRVSWKYMAAILGISERYLIDGYKKKPAIKEAIDAGRAKATSKVSEAAYRMAINQKNPDMTKFWLKVHEGWRDTERIELSGIDGEPLSVVQLTPAQREDKIKELMRKRKREFGENE